MAQDEVKKDYLELKNEIRSMSQQIDSIYQEKEEIFDKINAFKGELKPYYEEISERNEKISGLKELLVKKKDEKEVVFTELNDLNKKFKELLAKKPEGAGSMNIDGIKKKLNKLEYYLQVEALSFDKEKKIMRQINNLRGKYDSLLENEGYWKEYKEVRDKVRDLRKNFLRLKKEVRGINADIKSHIDSKKEIFKKLDEAKASRKELFDKVSTLKDEYKEKIGEKKDKLKTLKELAGDIEDANISDIKDDIKEVEMAERKAKSRGRKVNKPDGNIGDMLQKKGKLTMDDLLSLKRTR